MIVINTFIPQTLNFKTKTKIIKASSTSILLRLLTNLDELAIKNMQKYHIMS